MSPVSQEWLRMIPLNDETRSMLTLVANMCVAEQYPQLVHSRRGNQFVNENRFASRSNVEKFVNTPFPNLKTTKL